ncbi:MAG: hypothetical protein O3B70_01950 [Bacteroidetes bacterium]|nr:hypothetical protein [Bacteroidota bacterium]MDA0903073.1 hypothetical protein [Bacteroidota bacterium]MDA1241717.1 hypothetical protein [Bacteroidota bacterium]
MSEFQDLPPVTFVGSGKLGMAVAEAWECQGGRVARMVGRGESWTPEGLVFEATSPEAAKANVLRCVNARVPVVTGSTGWLQGLSEIEVAAQTHGSTAFWSTNFSPGVHALNLLAAYASQLMSRLDPQREHYQAMITEVHHVHKKDAPSGTALTLESHARRSGHSIPIESRREGDVVGLHTLTWDSAFDSVVLQHEAKNRDGFALGAISALRFVWQQHQLGRPGLYTMTDLLAP